MSDQKRTGARIWERCMGYSYDEVADIIEEEIASAVAAERARAEKAETERKQARADCNAACDLLERTEREAGEDRAKLRKELQDERVVREEAEAERDALRSALNLFLELERIDNEVESLPLDCDMQADEYYDEYRETRKRLNEALRALGLKQED